MSKEYEEKPAILHPLGMIGVSVASTFIIITSKQLNSELLLALKLFVVAMPLILCGALIEHVAFSVPDRKIKRIFSIIGKVINAVGDLVALSGFFWLIYNASDIASWFFLGSVIFAGIAIGVSAQIMNKYEPEE